jgi:hypothetical protein
MNDERLKQKYDHLCKLNGDINEHLPILYEYAKKCDTVTEFGVRYIVSTWAFLYANPKKMTSYDIADPSAWGASIDDVYGLKGTTDYRFIKASTLDIEIEETDLLFIDTIHTYDQVKKELELHSDKCLKYIIFHDTVTFAKIGEDGKEGIQKAIDELLLNNKWEYELFKTNNNGLTILKRKT